MPYARYSPQEVESRAHEIYEREIRPRIEAGNTGKYVVIDIESGEFELADDDVQATKCMLKKRPNAVLFGLRVGYPTAYTLGGQFATDEQ